jgi:hypothetical protein
VDDASVRASGPFDLRRATTPETGSATASTAFRGGRSWAPSTTTARRYSTPSAAAGAAARAGFALSPLRPFVYPRRSGRDPEEDRDTDALGSLRSNQWPGGGGGAPFPRRYGSDPGPPRDKLRAGRVLWRYGSVPNPSGRGLGRGVRCGDPPRSGLRGKVLKGSVRPGHEKRPAVPGGTSDH